MENSQLKQQLDSNQQQSEKEINQKMLEISQLRHQIEELTDLADEEVTRRQQQEEQKQTALNEQLKELQDSNTALK